MYRVLDDKLLRIQEAMEQELRTITLADVDADLRRCLEKWYRLWNGGSMYNERGIL